MKMKTKILLIIIAILIVIAIFVVPRPVLKDGYIHRTAHNIEYVDAIYEVKGYYLPTSDSQRISVVFDKDNESLYKSVGQNTVLKVKFKGMYYPITFHRLGMNNIRSQIVVTNLIESEIVAQ